MIKYGVIPSYIYTDEDSSLKISAANKYAYQINSLKNEFDYLRENKQRSSIIDLKECADILKKKMDLIQMMI